MFAAMKSKLLGNVSRLSGRLDALEAICAASALIAIADGEIEEAEVKSGIKAIKANAALSGAFDTRTIETTAERIFSRAEGGRVGRMGLMREIEQIAADPEIAEIVLCAAIDVAESDGQIEDAEKPILDKIAKALGLNVSNYM